MSENATEQEQRECRGCKRLLPLDRFRPQRHKCKDCCYDETMKWKKRNPEKVRLHRMQSHYKHRETRLEQQSEYRKTEAGKTLANRCSQKWRRKNLEKKRIEARVTYAIKTGRLVRPNSCSSCQKSCRPEAHHPDYSKSLEVKWLCGRCHYYADRGRLDEVTVA